MKSNESNFELEIEPNVEDKKDIVASSRANVKNRPLKIGALLDDDESKPLGGLSIALDSHTPNIRVSDSAIKSRSISPSLPIMPMVPHSPTLPSRSGRALPSIEVVVPRYADVKRRRLQAQAQRRRESLQVNSNGGDAHVAIVTQGTHGTPSGEVPTYDEEVKTLSLPPQLDQHNPKALRAAIEDMKNPDVKVKQELLLSDEFLLDALTWKGINYRYPIPLPKDIAEFPLRRDYITSLYGGSMQATYPKPSDELLEWHGIDDWMFLSMDFNPHAPTKPGCSGIAFACTDMPMTRRLFVRLAPAQWVYMGKYSVELGKDLTSEAFRQQKPNVRKAWAKIMLRQFYGTCIRVWLRRENGADYKITEEDEEEGLVRIKEIRASLTEDELMAAFDCGEEIMTTQTLTCIGYDKEFIQTLVRNADRFVPPERNAKKGAGSKRKPIEVHSDTESNQSDVPERLEKRRETENSKPPPARSRAKRTRT
ncbi:hypothetical protein C8Q78DRAFT_1083349 [Trametes maxima]|nr:hypothetical protein C8Q78DRAFT_1083349 [Trametes maxima]